MLLKCYFLLTESHWVSSGHPQVSVPWHYLCCSVRSERSGHAIASCSNVFLGIFPVEVSVDAVFCRHHSCEPASPPSVSSKQMAVVTGNIKCITSCVPENISKKGPPGSQQCYFTWFGVFCLTLLAESLWRESTLNPESYQHRRSFLLILLVHFRKLQSSFNLDPPQPWSVLEGETR